MRQHWPGSADPSRIKSWISDFCAQVEKHCFTDFYRGFCMIMDVFIKTDLDYLQELAAGLQ